MQDFGTIRIGHVVKMAEFKNLPIVFGQRLDRFPLRPYAAQAMGVREGDSVRAVALRPADR